MSKQTKEIKEPKAEGQPRTHIKPEINKPEERKLTEKPKSKKQKIKETESRPEQTSQEETFNLEESKIDIDLPDNPEDLSKSDLNKLRIKNNNLNKQLYDLESEKARGKISTKDFNLRKKEIIKSCIDQYHN
jgi:hypothetical protein